MRKRGLLQQKGAAILWPSGLVWDGRALDSGDRAGVAQDASRLPELRHDHSPFRALTLSFDLGFRSLRENRG